MENFKGPREGPEPNLSAARIQSYAYSTNKLDGLNSRGDGRRQLLLVATSAMHSVQETTRQSETHDSFSIVKVDNIFLGLKIDQR